MARYSVYTLSLRRVLGQLEMCCNVVDDTWHVDTTPRRVAFSPLQLKLSCCRLGSAERAHVSYLGGARDPHHRRHSPTLVLSHLRTGHACDWQLIERLRMGHAPLDRIRNGPRSAPSAAAALQQPNRSTAPSASPDNDDGHRRRGDAAPGRFPSPRTE